MATVAKQETLASALASAFAEIEGATKDKMNPHFKSKYADLSSVIDAIKPALVKHHLFFVQATHETQGGVCVETIVHHESGDCMSFGKLFVPAKNDAQGFGSALTYARRYSLMTAFGVPAEDDDGNAAVRPVANDRSAAADDPPPADEPAAREKLEGKHPCKSKLKEALKACHHKVGQASTIRELDAIVKEYAADIAQGIRYLPKWISGDPDLGSKGLEKVVEERRALLTLTDALFEIKTVKGRNNWFQSNWEAIEALDDVQRREFERLADEHEAAIKAMDRVTSGA